VLQDVPAGIDVIIVRLFYAWSWASAVQRQILADFEEHELQSEHGGNKSHALEMFLTLLLTRYDELGLDRRSKRTEQLISDNSHLFAAPDNIDLALVTVEPHPDDLDTWRHLALLFREYYEDMSSWPCFKAIADSLSGIFRQYSDIDDEEKEEESEIEFPLVQDLDEENLVNAMKAESSLFDATPSSDIEAMDVDSSTPEDSDVIEPSHSLNAKDSTNGSRRPRRLLEYGGHLNSKERERRITEYVNKQVDQILDACNVWDVWVLYRMMALMMRKRRSSYPFNEFFDSAAVTKHWKKVEVLISDDGSDCLRGFLARTLLYSIRRRKELYVGLCFGRS